ncbi:Uncharacterised protein [Mycobacteroides abscessus subsp. abscessus]|nr:Uncharacterised protein [Mycobacteroides abscessus subsp. abscessus]
MVAVPTCMVTISPIASIRATEVAAARCGLRAEFITARRAVGPRHETSRPTRRNRVGM